MRYKGLKVKEEINIKLIKEKHFKIIYLCLGIKR